MSKTAFGLSGTPTPTLVHFYNGKHRKGEFLRPLYIFLLISPRAFIDAFSFSILSSLILTSGRRHSPTSKPIRLRASLTGDRVYVAEKCLCKTKGLEYLFSCFLVLSIKAELCDLMCFKMAYSWKELR